MSLLFFDVETRSAAALTTVGEWRYARDPTIEVLCLAYAIDAAPVQLWIPGQPVPPEFYDAANDPSWRVVAHNFQFERAILTHVLGPRFGFPQIPLAQQICSVSLALASALPGALDSAARAAGLDYQKDREGYRVMLQMAKPRKPRKGEDRKVLHWVDDPDKREKLHRYCMHDVEIERALFQRLPPLTEFESTLYRRDAAINMRGFQIDTALAVAARDAAKNEQALIKAEIASLTNGKIVSADQVEKIKAFIHDHGHTLASLTKRSVAQMLAHELPDQVRRLLELRREGARASTKKLDRLLASVDTDSRLRSTLRFHAASTGRWSGRGYQPQNLKKPETKDLEAAVQAVMSGDAARIRALGPVLTIVGDISRAIVCAAPGHILVGGDFSAIESRVLAWLAGEDWKINNYREFDATGRPELEPYCATASRVFRRSVTPEDKAGRSVGKTCDLAFGYGGGLKAWRKFSSAYTDPEVEQFKTTWRREHPATVRFWRNLERIVHHTVISGRPHNLDGGKISCRMNEGYLLLALPSGRDLSYPQAALGPGKFEGTRELRFKDNARGGWADTSAWYGQLTENVVQAVARDLLAAAILRVGAAGYDIVLHVHDEIVCEVPDGFGEHAGFLGLLTELPTWSAALPMAAKVWTGKRYTKSDTPTAPIAIGPEPAPPEPYNAEGVAFKVEPAPAGAASGSEDVPALADVIGESPDEGGFILCPFHPDQRPSLKIYEDHFHCFTCGSHGYAIDWLTQVEGMTATEARRFLANWDGPTAAAPRPVKDAKEQNIRNALRLWDEAEEIKGTPAERYLMAWRKIKVAALPDDVDAALRFHPRCPFKRVRHPCLLALMRDLRDNRPCGIHRVALGSDDNRIERAMLGQAGAVKLWPAGERLVVGEGIETVLAGATRVPYRGAPLQPAWSLVSKNTLTQFPVLPGVEQLIILVDHDTAGKTAAAECRERWRRAGRGVVCLTPPTPGTDFNDPVIAGDRRG
jgi:DNA polymerase family A/Toprim domain/CHC2 zinc finger